MTQPINRDNLNDMITNETDFELIETLPSEKYEEFHLPGATNVPVDESFEQNIQRTVPNKNATIVVYCWDTECDASSKAASKLDALGYTNVFDYEEGKKAWKDAGLSVVTGTTATA